MLKGKLKYAYRCVNMYVCVCVYIAHSNHYLNGNFTMSMNAY